MVLLVSWLRNFELRNKWDVVDMFAGAGRIARLARACGDHSVALDRDYSTNPHAFDINESAGFVPLGL